MGDDNRTKISETFGDSDSLVHWEETNVVDAGMVVVTLSVPVLRKVEKIIQLIVTNTSPATTTGAISNVKLSGLSIGMTLENIGVGTTLVTQCAVVGF